MSPSVILPGCRGRTTGCCAGWSDSQQATDKVAAGRERSASLDRRNAASVTPASSATGTRRRETRHAASKILRARPGRGCPARHFGHRPCSRPCRSESASRKSRPSPPLPRRRVLTGLWQGLPPRRARSCNR